MADMFLTSHHGVDSKDSASAYLHSYFHPRGRGRKGSKYLVNIFAELTKKGESSDHGKDFIC